MDVAEEMNISCALTKVPYSDENCDWTGPWKEQIAHFLVSHRSMLHYDNVVQLEPEKPKAVLAYRDMFITYAAYHKNELACLVMHTCSCITPYYYRCTLLSGNSNCGDIQSGITLLFKKVKKFRSIRKHKDVTRFRPEQLDPRKDLEGKTRILIEILGPDCEGALRTVTPGPSTGGGKDGTSEEDKSSDEESIPKQAMNATCKICWATEDGRECCWSGTEADLEDHLMKSHGVMLGLSGHCSQDLERVAPFINSSFSESEKSFSTNSPFFDYNTNRPTNCIVEFQPNLCCSTIVLPEESWRYGWPLKMGDINYSIMWDDFKPATMLYIPSVWEHVPVLGTYPCHVACDSSELKTLVKDKCPCISYNSVSVRPFQMAYCPLTFAPGKTGICSWMGSSDDVYDHLLIKHQSVVELNDRIVLQIDQPRILFAYRDVFVCYINYDRGDVICVVLHACSCSKVFMYRSSLFSEIQGYSEVDGNIRYIINTCKDFRCIRASPDVTRFPRAVVQPRKNSSGEISVELQIYPAVEPNQKEPPKSTPEYNHPWKTFLEETSGADKPSGFGPDRVKSRASTSKVSTSNAPKKSKYVSSSVIAKCTGKPLLADARTRPIPGMTKPSEFGPDLVKSRASTSKVSTSNAPEECMYVSSSVIASKTRTPLLADAKTQYIPAENKTSCHIHTPFSFTNNNVDDVSTSTQGSSEERRYSNSTLTPFASTERDPGFYEQSRMSSFMGGAAETQTSTSSVYSLMVPVERLTVSQRSTPSDSPNNPSFTADAVEVTAFSLTAESPPGSSRVKAYRGKYASFRQWVMRYKNKK